MRPLDRPTHALDLIPDDDQPPDTLGPLSIAGLGDLANLSAHSGPDGGSRILRLRWDLHATQHAFVTSPARFSLFVGGLGSGKTTAGAVRAILRARDHQGSLGFIGGIVSDAHTLHSRRFAWPNRCPPVRPMRQTPSPVAERIPGHPTILGPEGPCLQAWG